MFIQCTSTLPSILERELAMIHNHIHQTTLSWDRVEAYLYGFILIDGRTVQLSQNFESTTNQYQSDAHIDSGYASEISSEPNGKQQTTSQHTQTVEIGYFQVGKLKHRGLFATQHIQSGVYLGQIDFTACSLLPHIINQHTQHHQNSFINPLDTTNQQLITNTKAFNYMSTARSNLESNVQLFHHHQNKFIFFTTKFINPGDELLFSLIGWIHTFLSNFSLPNILTQQTPPTSDRYEFTQQHLHINLSTDINKKHQCDKCGSAFTSQHYLLKHKNYTSCSDSIERKFVCSICDRRFEKEERLRVHIRQVHDKLRPYQCQTCKKNFSQSSSLTKHVRIHTGVKPYKCQHCPKEFTASSILTTHMRQHTGEKPFICICCKRSFASHAAHHSHVRRTHNMEPHELRALNLASQ